jgi:hypothetical protein
MIHIDTVARLHHAKKIFDENAAYEPGGENPFNRRFNAVPPEATYYIIVFDNRPDDLALAKAVLDGLHLQGHADIPKEKIFDDPVRQLGIDWTAKIAGAKAHLFYA